MNDIWGFRFVALCEPYISKFYRRLQQMRLWTEAVWLAAACYTNLTLGKPKLRNCHTGCFIKRGIFPSALEHITYFPFLYSTVPKYLKTVNNLSCQGWLYGGEGRDRGWGWVWALGYEGAVRTRPPEHSGQPILSQACYLIKTNSEKNDNCSTTYQAQVLCQLSVWSPALTLTSYIHEFPHL